MGPRFKAGDKIRTNDEHDCRLEILFVGREWYFCRHRGGIESAYPISRIDNDFQLAEIK